MAGRKRILFISNDLFSLLDPVNNSVGYSVSIAEDGSKALKCLEREDFDAVIISIEQLPPGSNPDLIKLFSVGDFNSNLGWGLLYLLFSPDKLADVLGPRNIPSWFHGQSKQFAVLSSDTQKNISARASELGIVVRHQLTAETPHDVLLTLITQLVN